MTWRNAHQYLKKVYLTTKNDSFREALSVALTALRGPTREMAGRAWFRKPYTRLETRETQEGNRQSPARETGGLSWLTWFVPCPASTAQNAPYESGGIRTEARVIRAGWKL